MQLPIEIENKRTLLAEFCTKYKVQKGEAIMRLWTDLENLLSRKVDLLTTPARNPYLQKQIEATKQLIYDSVGNQNKSSLFIEGRSFNID